MCLKLRMFSFYVLDILIYKQTIRILMFKYIFDKFKQFKKKTTKALE